MRTDMNSSDGLVDRDPGHGAAAIAVENPNYFSGDIEAARSSWTSRLSENASRWLALSLLGLIFVYPLHWVSDFLLYVLPAIFRAASPGVRLTGFELHMFAVSAETSASQNMPQVSELGWNSVLESNIAWLLILLTIAAVLRYTRGYRSLPGALGLATLAHAALVARILQTYYDLHHSAPAFVALLIYFAIFCGGVRWIVSASGVKRFWSRFAAPMLSLALPQVALWSLIAWMFHFTAWNRLQWDLPPIILASLLVSTRPSLRLPERSKPISARVLRTAAAVLIIFTGAIYAASRAVADAKARADRAVLAALPAVAADAPYPKLFFQRGVSFVSGPDNYESQAGGDVLKQLPSYGVDAIALVPYGIEDHTVSRVRPWTTSWASENGIRELARLAHSLGLKVLLKPHLWQTAGNGGTPDFADSAARVRWFADYETFLDHYAALAAEIHADIFCVRVEFEKTSVYDADWRRLIARVRQIYPGPLTYAAASGPEFEHVTFWDALDYIGINEYYSLPADLSTDDIVRRIALVQQKFNRPVLFTEAGFPSLENPNEQPWDRSPRKLDGYAQARCYDAIFRAFYDKPWFAGVYWWEVPTNGLGGLEDGSHTPWEKPAMSVLRRWYSRPAANDWANSR